MHHTPMHHTPMHHTTQKWKIYGWIIYFLLWLMFLKGIFYFPHIPNTSPATDFLCGKTVSRFEGKTLFQKFVFVLSPRASSQAEISHSASPERHVNIFSSLRHGPLWTDSQLCLRSEAEKYYFWQIRSLLGKLKLSSPLGSNWIQ